MKKRSEFPVYALLEKKSKFFCPAKWNELFLYLNHGNTNSCHHPLPHRIPEELLADPFVLHNTPHKLEMQRLMMAGQRPQECHMCWHVEDLGPDVVSDRILKSQHAWADTIQDLQVDPHHVPKFIEVVFDNYCNLSCSYCDSGQSSTWATKITQAPLYLKTDHRDLYNKVHIEPGKTKQNYYEAWLRWWAEIGDQVQYLRISGGEPLLSVNFWQWIEQFDRDKFQHLRFSINSNLSMPGKWVDRLIDHSTKFREITIAASIDATGPVAEYARQGLKYQQFLDNIENWCVNTEDHCVIYLQSTVNILNIWGLLDKFELALELRSRWPNKVRGSYSTLVRMPEFQSVNLLPRDLKQGLAQKIQSWLDRRRAALTQDEQIYLEKTCAYLLGSPESMVDLKTEDLQVDFKKFLLYYNQSSVRDFRTVYPREFIQWIDSIPDEISYSNNH